MAFTVELDDLSATPPVGSDGVYVNFGFAFNGTNDEVVMTCNSLGEESFRLRIPAGTAGSGSVTVADNLEGAFDNDADTVSAIVPHDLLATSAA